MSLKLLLQELYPYIKCIILNLFFLPFRKLVNFYKPSVVIAWERWRDDTTNNQRMEDPSYLYGLA